MRDQGLDSLTVARAVPFVAAAMVFTWALVGVASSSAQWGDHFEQFVWAHSIEWGYHKHPPLPTWMLAFAIDLFGPSIESARLLALGCAVGTGVFTYRVARELFDRPTAAFALLFWGLQQPFSNRCHLFNHNSVLMLAASATAWSCLRALHDPRSLVRWLIVGALAGLALLTKYQAIIPLAGIAGAMWLTGEFASRQVRTGMAVAALAAAALFAPHVVWVMQHDFSTLHYAGRHIDSLGWGERVLDGANFIGQQLRLLLPALLFAAFLAGMARHASAPEGQGRGPTGSDRQQRAWLFGLVAIPFLLTLCSGLLLGLKLQNHWGYQALQFAGLFFAWQVRSRACSARPAWIVIALVVHVAFLGVALALPSYQAADHRVRKDAAYPARELASMIRQDWQDDTSCPLAIVVGPSFEAGIVSVYNGGTAVVLEDGDFAKSPWITPLDVQSRGAVYVSTDRSKLPSAGVTRVGAFDVSVAAPSSTTQIYWAIQPPVSCAGQAL